MTATTKTLDPKPEAQQPTPGTLGEKIESRQRLRTEQALDHYRQAVTAAAMGEPEPTGKQLDDLANAIAELRLTAADFDADVQAYRSMLDARAAVEKLPTQAERDTSNQECLAKIKALEEEIQAKQAELRQVRYRFITEPSHIVSVEQRLDQVIRDNPRLFGTWPPKTKVPNAVIVPQSIFG